MNKNASHLNNRVSLMDKFLSPVKRFYSRAMHLISSVKRFSLCWAKNASRMNKNVSLMKKSALRMKGKGLFMNKNVSFVDKISPRMKEIYPRMIGFNSHVLHFASRVIRYNSCMHARVRALNSRVRLHNSTVGASNLREYGTGQLSCQPPDRWGNFGDFNREQAVPVPYFPGSRTILPGATKNFPGLR
jgi:hypothetical protein